MNLPQVGCKNQVTQYLKALWKKILYTYLWSNTVIITVITNCCSFSALCSKTPRSHSDSGMTAEDVNCVKITQSWCSPSKTCERAGRISSHWNHHLEAAFPKSAQRPISHEGCFSKSLINTFETLVWYYKLECIITLWALVIRRYLLIDNSLGTLIPIFQRFIVDIRNRVCWNVLQ